MKRKITGLFLVLAMCLLLLPESVWAEGEEQGSKTVITSVDELLKFAKAVNAGDYDEKTDAVVVLDADLDLSGVECSSINIKLHQKLRIYLFFHPNQLHLLLL